MQLCHELVCWLLGIESTPHIKGLFRSPDAIPDITEKADKRRWLLGKGACTMYITIGLTPSISTLTRPQFGRGQKGSRPLLTFDICMYMCVDITTVSDHKLKHFTCIFGH